MAVAPKSIDEDDNDEEDFDPAAEYADMVDDFIAHRMAEMSEVMWEYYETKEAFLASVFLMMEISTLEFAPRAADYERGEQLILRCKGDGSVKDAPTAEWARMVCDAVMEEVRKVTTRSGCANCDSPYCPGEAPPMPEAEANTEAEEIIPN